MVLVTAEPGDPYHWESYPSEGTLEEQLEASCTHVYEVLRDGPDLYHRNIRYILDQAFPGSTFREQMCRTWVTDSVLCSARVEGGSVPAAVARECRSRYLEAQLQLFPRAIVAALGSKARNRLRGWPRVMSAIAVAPSGCNLPAARPSWNAIAAAVRRAAVAERKQR